MANGENGKSSKIILSTGKVTFWIGIIASLCVVSASLIAAGAWVTVVQTDIATLRVKVADIELGLERLKQDGTKLSQNNSAELKVLTAEYNHIKEGMEKNDKAHEAIMNKLDIVLRNKTQ